jgi:hypothetical protein
VVVDESHHHYFSASGCIAAELLAEGVAKA